MNTREKMIRSTNAKIENNSIFAVPLLDGSHAIGVFHKFTPKPLNSCICSFYNYATNKTELEIENKLNRENAISLIFTTPDSLKAGKWLMLDGSKSVFQDSELPDFKYNQIGSYKGAKVYGSGIVRKFLNAYFGLMPWDMMKDPDYFQNLLLEGAPQRRL